MLISTHKNPFDAVACGYDAEFEHNPITARIRPVVWQSLLKYFKPGQHVLELNCGTGTDAMMLAQRGLHVTAIDSSEVMLDVARAKIHRAGLDHYVAFRKMGFSEISLLQGETYDGAFSNFGGLNCVSDVSALARHLSQLLKPDSPLIVCLMNKLCLWEIGSFLLRGRFTSAFRRFYSTGVEARLGSGNIRVWYYTPQQFFKIVEPWFTPGKVYGLNIVSPTPNSHRFATKHPRMTTVLLGIDDHIRDITPLSGLGDHVVLELRRRKS